MVVLKRVQEEKTAKKCLKHCFDQPWNTQEDEHVFAYCRVSTTQQHIENQFEDIAKYCRENKINIPITNVYFDVGVSGSVSWRKRSIKTIVDAMPENGVLIVVEISRIGRSGLEVMYLIQTLLEKKVTFHDIKNDMEFDNLEDDDRDLIKVFILSLQTQMELNGTKKRVKASFQNEKNKKFNKLDEHEELIRQRLKEGVNCNKISIELECNKSQVYTFCRRRGINTKVGDDSNDSETESE